jgi:DNA-binding NtrC family response regulator
MARILVVDDEIGIRELLSEILYDEGHTVELAENAAQARESRLRQRPDLVLLDIWMPDIDGVSLLKEWSSQGLLNMPVIMMSGHATVDTAVEATRIGAVDFLEKPITLQKLLKTVAAGLARPVIPASMRSRTERPVASADPVFTQPPALAGGPAAVQPAGVVPAAAPVHDDSHLGRISLNQPLREARDEFERIYFEYHLLHENHSMTRVSERTGLERTHLYRKLKQLGIDTSRKKPSGS